ncbi:MAG: type II secretion system protein [Desulfobacteraceae bacterium]|nr:type II secretion system protein [Desulfobacteraceae bacterium]
MERILRNRNLIGRNSKGFTLIEMLIVIIVLGILAMLIIPQITVSSDDARTNTLQSNLNTMRSAIELYYHEHSQIYPGSTKQTDGTAVISDAEAATAFPLQLTLYTDINGQTNNSKTAVFKYGPYLKGGKLPLNPYTSTYTIECDFDEADITIRTATTTSAWRFFPLTGVLIANDSAAHALF